MDRVMSSCDFLSITTKSTFSITRRRISASVMYRLSTVSYRRRFGYFLITLDSLMVEVPRSNPELATGRASSPFIVIYPCSYGSVVSSGSTKTARSRRLEFRTVTAVASSEWPSPTAWTPRLDAVQMAAIAAEIVVHATVPGLDREDPGRRHRRIWTV